MSPARLLPLVLALSTLGCGVEVCEAGTMPAAFEGIEADLPAEMVFCKEEGNYAASGDAMTNRAHVNFALESPHHAWLAMVDHFEAKGWEVVEQRTEGTLAVKFVHVENGYALDFSVFNENDADSRFKKFRVHANVMISQAPCLQKFGDDDSVCMDNTLVRCAHGMPGERIDCAAQQLSCAGEEYGASACVSDLCLASKAATRKWDPESCPAELAKPK